MLRVTAGLLVCALTVVLPSSSAAFDLSDTQSATPAQVLYVGDTATDGNPRKTDA